MSHSSEWSTLVTRAPGFPRPTTVQSVWGKTILVQRQSADDLTACLMRHLKTESGAG